MGDCYLERTIIGTDNTTSQIDLNIGMIASSGYVDSQVMNITYIALGD